VIFYREINFINMLKSQHYPEASTGSGFSRYSPNESTSPELTRRLMSSIPLDLRKMSIDKIIFEQEHWTAQDSQKDSASEIHTYYAGKLETYQVE
jgi:aromatic ring-opening dioxygenase catalytic subunit (LigB family)